MYHHTSKQFQEIFLKTLSCRQNFCQSNEQFLCRTSRLSLLKGKYWTIWTMTTLFEKKILLFIRSKMTAICPKKWIKKSYYDRNAGFWTNPWTFWIYRYNANTTKHIITIIRCEFASVCGRDRSLRQAGYGMTW